MAYFEQDDAGEPTGQVRVFNRGVAIVERVTRLENELFQAYEMGDTSVAIRKAKTLLLDLSPVLHKKRKGATTETKYEELIGILKECEGLQADAEIAYSDEIYNSSRADILDKLDFIILEIRSATHKLGMDFPKGIDPLDAWAEG